MGYQAIFRSLLELFPQVDNRVLKAVAIEHCKDIESAVEFIVSEVLPSLERIPEEPVQNNTEAFSYGGDKLQEGMGSCSSNLQEPDFFAESLEDPCSEPVSMIYEDSSDTNEHLYSISEPHSDHQDGPLVDSLQCQPSDPISVTCEHAVVTGHCNDDLSSMTHDSNGTVAGDLVSSLRGKDQDQLNCVTVASNVENLSVTVQNLPLEGNLSATVQNLPLEGMPHIIESEDINIRECEDKETLLGNLLTNNTEKISFDFESSPKKLSSGLDSTTIDTRSGEIFSMDLLDDFVGEAKKSKKTFLLAMETVCRMMKKAEVCEKAADYAKLEAAEGGLDILAEVEDLSKILSSAKEANAMHTGEIYGERAILGTEARELQSRLLNLSNEREKSLSIIDKMRESLEARIAIAEAEIAAAEEEKLEKEKSAREALASQELIMAKVVEESKKLKQEAEENSRLREFLVDRGRIVDGLQGEIAVICEDVNLLKEKLDRHLAAKLQSPNESISVLSSSTSSIRSRVSGKDFDLVESFKSAKMTGDELANSDWYKPVESSSPKGKAAGDVGKVSCLDSDGWEDIFTHEALYG